MPRSIREWLKHPWREQTPKDLLDAYNITFSGYHGEKVLQHLLDNVYCSIYVGTDPIELASHNARRSVVQDILQILDQAHDPVKYRIEVDNGRDVAVAASS